MKWLLHLLKDRRMAALDLADAQTFANLSSWESLERVLLGRCYANNNGVMD